MHQQELVRNCPNCQCQIFYKTVVLLEKAIKKSTTCQKCKTNKWSTPAHKIEPMLMLNKAGYSNREIGKILELNHRTVSDYLKKNNRQSPIFSQPIDMVSDSEAKCRKCGDVKSINEFQYGRKGQQYEYRFSYCNVCRRKQIRDNLNSDVNKFLSNSFHRIKLRATKNAIPFTISKSQFIEQFYAQNGLCFYTDVPLVCKVYNSLDRNSLSVDKIVPERGYVLGNVVFTTHRINTCKCDLSLDEIQKWMPEWYNRIRKFLGLV